MKKEIFSISLLAVMLITAFINIWCINKLTDEMTVLITESADAAKAENWTRAEECAELAEKTWYEKDGYTHIVLRHSEIDTVSDALYEFLSYIYERDALGTASGAKKVIYHLDSIYKME